MTDPAASERESLRKPKPFLRTILVGTDFSKASARALSFAVSLASSQGARIVVLHVLSEPVQALDVAGALTYIDQSTRKDWEDAADKQLGREIKAVQKRGVAATSEVCWGRPSDSIVERATALKVSLIVVGTHGRSALEKFLIGSTAERVVRLSGIPVLTVREKKSK